MAMPFEKNYGLAGTRTQVSGYLRPKSPKPARMSTTLQVHQKSNIASRLLTFPARQARDWETKAAAKAIDCIVSKRIIC